MQTTHYARANELEIGDLVAGHMHNGREIPFSTPATIVRLSPLELVNPANETTSMTVSSDHLFILVDR